MKNSEVTLIRKSVASALSSISGRDDSKVEVEARFDYPNFVKGGVPRQVFDALFNELVNTPEEYSYKVAKFSQKMKDSIVVDKKGNNLRRTTGIKGNFKEVVKRKYGVHVNKFYPYKTAISTERNGFSDKERNFFNSSKSPLVRIKERFSFFIGSMLKIDMTVVRGGKYEVEIELRKSPDVKGALDTLLKRTRWLAKKMLRTTLMYTIPERDRLVKYLNSTVGTPYLGGVNHALYNQARDLKYDDLRDGGIFGYSNVLKKNVGYTITHKADGERKMLVIFDNAAWYVVPPFFIDKIRKDLIGFSDMIFDGELVKLKFKSREYDIPGDYIYLIIDVISMRDSFWLKRHDYAKQQSKLFQREKLPIFTKDFHQFFDAPSFFNTNRRLLTLSDSKAYKTDGLMFTPINTKYKTDMKLLPLAERTLNIYYEIIKYKPPEELSIDVRVAKDEGGKVYLQVTLPRGKPGRFTGTRRHPLKDNMIDHEHLYPYIGKIVELRWDGSRLVFKGVRMFKPSPNRSDVVRMIWGLFNDPITIETITGRNLILLFKNNNVIKSKLIDRIDKGSVILDIGSGPGGDIGKWKRAELGRVYALEPDPDNLKELEIRRKFYDMEKIITIIPSEAEDFKDIEVALDGRKVDVVTSMFSLSFFEDFKTISTILERFLKPNGSFIYFTIDGDAVRETFKPTLNIVGKYEGVNSFKYGLSSRDLFKLMKEGGDKSNEFKPFLGEDVFERTLFEITKVDDNVIDITIVGSKTAERQREFLVNITQLHQTLHFNNFKSILRERADKETFLPEESFRITNLYSYGEFSRRKSSHSVIRRLDPVGPMQHPFLERKVKSITVDTDIPIFFTPVKTKQKRMSETSETSETSELNEVKLDYSPIHLEHGSITSLVEPDHNAPPLPPLIVRKKEKIEHLKTKIYPRKTLPVVANINMKVAMGDDISDQLSSKEFGDMKVFRVAVINDDVSLLHSILKATNFMYQKNNNYIWRRDLVKNLNNHVSLNIGEISTAMKIGIYVIVPYEKHIEILRKSNMELMIVLSYNNFTFSPIFVENDNQLYKTVFEKDDPFIKILDSF